MASVLASAQEDNEEEDDSSCDSESLCTHEEENDFEEDDGNSNALASSSGEQHELRPLSFLEKSLISTAGAISNSTPCLLASQVAQADAETGSDLIADADANASASSSTLSDCGEDVVAHVQVLYSSKTRLDLHVFDIFACDFSWHRRRPVKRVHSRLVAQL